MGKSSLKELDLKRLRKRHNWVIYGLFFFGTIFVRTAIDLIRELVRDELEQIWLKVGELSLIIVIVILVVYLVRIDKEMVERKKSED